MTKAERIRAALKQRGLTMKVLAARSGVVYQYLDLSLREPRPKGNRIIAAALGRTVFELWPEWYRPDGSRHCKVGKNVWDAILRRIEAGDIIHRVLAEPRAPNRGEFWRYRKLHPEYDARVLAAIGRRQGSDANQINADDMERAIEALKEGASIKELGRRGIMGRETFRKYQKMVPEFGARTEAILAERKAKRQAWRRDKNRRTWMRRTAHVIAEKAVSKHLPPQMREEIKNDLAAALLTGSVRRENAPAKAKELVTAYNRMFGRRDLSMDEDRGGWTLAGVISDSSASPRFTGFSE